MSRDGIAWVDALLSQWGRWSIRCESGALGFAASCSLGGSGDGDSYDSAPPRGLIDGDMEAVDGAVRRLVPRLKEVVIQVYVHGAGKSLRKNAQALGIGRSTLERRLDEAQRKIALDIANPVSQNPAQSVIGGSSLETNEPGERKPAGFYFV